MSTTIKPVLREFHPSSSSPVTLESGISASTCTSTYTSDVFDRINDGSYKDAISIFSPSTPLTTNFDLQKELANVNQPKTPDYSSIKLIKEFESKKEHDVAFDRKSLDKSLKKAVRAYDKLWLAVKELKQKNVNGECIYMKLQINHIQIAKINLAIRLHDYYYANMIKILKEYEDPCNDIPSIKREIISRMPPVFEELHDTLLKIQYLDSEINKLRSILQNRYTKNRDLKFWCWCKYKGISLD